MLILAVLIAASLLFAVIVAYKLYKAETFLPPTIQEAISETVNSIPPAEQKIRSLVAVLPSIMIEEMGLPNIN